MYEMTNFMKFHLSFESLKCPLLNDYIYIYISRIIIFLFTKRLLRSGKFLFGSNVEYHVFSYILCIIIVFIMCAY